MLEIASMLINNKWINDRWYPQTTTCCKVVEINKVWICVTITDAHGVPTCATHKLIYSPTQKERMNLFPANESIEELQRV